MQQLEKLTVTLREKNSVIELLEVRERERERERERGRGREGVMVKEINQLFVDRCRLIRMG